LLRLSVCCHFAESVCFIASALEKNPGFIARGPCAVWSISTRCFAKQPIGNFPNLHTFLGIWLPSSGALFKIFAQKVLTFSAHVLHSLRLQSADPHRETQK
jgi:hypothetical protein